MSPGRPLSDGVTKRERFSAGWTGAVSVGLFVYVAIAIALTASIAVVEARHATVLADLLGVDDLDVLFGNDQSALELTGDDA